MDNNQESKFTKQSNVVTVASNDKSQPEFTQEEMSKRNVERAEDSFKIYAEQFPKLIRLLNDVLQKGKDKLLEENSKNEKLCIKINSIQMSRDGASIKIEETIKKEMHGTVVESKVDTEFKLEILQKQSKNFTNEENKRLSDIHAEIEKENQKVDKKDTKKLNQLEREKYSIDHYVRASYISKLLEITETLHSLLKKVTTVTLNRNEKNSSNSQTFSKTTTYNGTHTAFAKGTATLYSALKLDQLIPDIAGIKSAGLVVEKGEGNNTDKVSVTTQGMNEFLLHNYHNDAFNIKEGFTFKQLTDVLYSGNLNLKLESISDDLNSSEHSI